VTANRRYQEQEIALILEQASAAQERAQDQGAVALPTTDAHGLTLQQLQEIGTDVGIAPEFVERAARAVDRGDLVPTQRRTWLGLPVGVARTIDFGRTVSDAEWDRIVVTLRETFEARGRLQRDGSFRQWTNGNLQALLEPSATGHRLRLSTRKSDVTPRVLIGAAMLLNSAVILFTGVLGPNGLTTSAMIGVAVTGVIGLASLLSVGLVLPRWARTRAAQMEHIAARTLDAPDELPGGSASALPDAR
jgi:hypothetical protein